ncbi:alpha-latrocrustotoxin [Plakobranchus ocellatus]|uniref:Alpha-latrocrustotoxin n=1 Tax=Plakobranchus ocellatus TaxID=259542 RepID=A0AAV3YQM4_9GAST|nr:alpha-latrocrustotoxin [Plakobranchus ocellatus]
MAFVFHVEFGMNDTPLTQALEKGNYASAERLILDCPNSSYLDDGCYQRTPLYICLCGVDEFHQRVATRNLYLARLLIEHGANVNKRVPVTNFGSEYISPGKTSLELLVDFFIELTQDSSSDGQTSLWRSWNPSTEPVVGLNKQYLTRREDVKEDVLDIIFCILRHGGDVNVQDEHRRTPLHRVARLCTDVSLLRLLHTNGGSLIQLDATGNCPLLALCSVKKSEEDDEDAWDVSSASSADSGAGAEGQAREQDETEKLWRAKLRLRRESLLYLIKAKEIDINRQNSLGQTALVHAILREDFVNARLLLEAGACPSLQACVWKSRRKKRKLSALFVSLMSIPLQRSLHHSSLYNRMVKPVQPISVLVDAGYFTTEEVVNELSSLIASDFPEFSHLRPMADSLLHLMFGYKSASLKQLAARKVFQCCLLENTACLHAILPVSAILDSYPAAATVASHSSLSPTHSPSSAQAVVQAQSLPQLLKSSSGKLEEYLTLVLNCTVLQQLTQLLQLPISLQLHFEAQLLFLRMLLKFSSLTIWRPATQTIIPLGGHVGIGIHQGAIGRFVPGGGIFRIGDDSDDSGEDEDVEDSSDGNSSSEENVEGDSDIEYW